MSRTRTSSPASSGPSSPTSDRSSLSGDEHFFNRDDFALLESWEDPTPRPSTSTLKELCDAWDANAKLQLILKPKSPSCEEMIRRSQEHDRKSLMIALSVYAKQNDVQSSELKLLEIKERNLIDEKGKGYVHFNFLVKILDGASSLFFAEVHPHCREDDDVYSCIPLDESDCGHCFGCKERAKDLKHPSSGGYLGGHMDVRFPFMYLESSSDEEED